MAQPGTCPPEVVRSEPLDTRFAGVLAEHVPDCLSVRPSPQAFVLVYPPKQPAGGYVGNLKPLIQWGFDPARHWHGPGVAGFALQVDDGPVVFTLLYVAEMQIHRLVPPKAAGEQDSQKCAIPFTFNCRESGAFQSRCDCSGVNQFPSRTPIFLTSLTRRMPAARSGLNRPQSEAS